MAFTEINLNSQKPVVEHHVQALSPVAQEEVEKSAIQADPRLQRLIGDEIPEIYKAGDHYEVVTPSHQVRVDVEYIHREHCCGPAQFELSFSSIDQ